MTSSKTVVAKAVGGKSARACDSCISKRARWYCAADDAFLCQSCDSLVHSANPLARRHERVRLKTASFKSSSVVDLTAAAAVDLALAAPSWHRGFTKKARTPRHGKNHSSAFHRTPRGHNNDDDDDDDDDDDEKPTRNNPFHLVPEVGSDEYSNSSQNEEEEQLLYRVPIFEPFVAELCSTPPPSSLVTSAAAADNKEEEKSKVALGNCNNLHGFLPSEMELAEFAADVESLLGRGLENECIGMEDLGLMDNHNSNKEEECCVKIEEDHEENPKNNCKVETMDEIEMEVGIREPFELSFDYDSATATCEEEEEEKNMKNTNDDDDGEIEGNNNNLDDERKRKRKILLLQLDYDSVISAWACQKSPWTTGDKPDLDSDECWPDCMGHQNVQGYYGEMGGYGCNNTAMGDGGREARVTRYREKRRTRLFSKKIRYEVRKLNAEKRPRMKGRFVKRASFAVAPPPSSSVTTAAAFSFATTTSA